MEFKNEAVAKRTLEKKQKAKIHGRVLIVDRVGEAKVPEAVPEAVTEGTWGSVGGPSPAGLGFTLFRWRDNKSSSLFNMFSAFYL